MLIDKHFKGFATCKSLDEDFNAFITFRLPGFCVLPQGWRKLSMQGAN